jgi:hypothetical protein
MKKGMLAVVTLAILGCASLAMAEERAASVTSMTRAQFEALAPEASIDINGTKMTKREFQARNQKAAEEAARMIAETKSRAKEQFDALVQRKLADDKAALAAGNREVAAEIQRLKQGATAATSSEADARRKKAAELLEQARKLEQEAAALMAPAK